MCQRKDDKQVHDNSGGHHHGGNERSMFAPITVAVCHCGASCVLGDIVGEWLVYGTHVTIHGRALWPEYLIGSYPLLILPSAQMIYIIRTYSYHLRFWLCNCIRHNFLILFHRANGWGIWAEDNLPRSESRLSIAGFLSDRTICLDGDISSRYLSVEARNGYCHILVDDAGKCPKRSACRGKCSQWPQIGMFLGHWTACPINWWLIKENIKEPCA